MAEITYGKIAGMTGACPVCAGDLFRERTPVRTGALWDDRHSAAIYPPGSSSWEPIGATVLECVGCGSQFSPRILGTAGERQPIDEE